MRDAHSKALCFDIYTFVRVNMSKSDINVYISRNNTFERANQLV